MAEDPDVSNFQGVVGWAAEAAAGVALGACKATEDLNFIDPTFDGPVAHNWADIAANGLFRIAYHYGHPTNSPQAEAAFFRRVVGPLDGRSKIALDLEAYGPNPPGWALAFCMECEQQFQVDPSRIMVYTGRWFIDGTGGPGAWQPLADRYPDGYWYSAYTAQLVVERLAPWTRCCLWQNTDSSRQPGVNGVCDGNIVENGGYFTAATPNKPTAPKGYPHLNQPVTGGAPTHSGKGYWMVAGDGGVFNYGDAGFFGSLGDTKLNAPIVGMAASPTDKGYVLFGADGGVFTFGDAEYHGSIPALDTPQH